MGSRRTASGSLIDRISSKDNTPKSSKITIRFDDEQDGGKNEDLNHVHRKEGSDSTSSFSASDSIASEAKVDQDVIQEVSEHSDSMKTDSDDCSIDLSEEERKASNYSGSSAEEIKEEKKK